MRILLYEYFTAGGLWSDSVTPASAEGFLVQGRAMLRALAEDLAQVPGTELVRFCDSRLADDDLPAVQAVPISGLTEELERLAQWSRRVDAILLIAPETGARLADRCRHVERSGGRLLSPDSNFVELAGDKTRTARRLQAAGVPTPEALPLDPLASPPASFPYPAVWKPIDGAGSWDTWLVATHAVAAACRPRTGPSRLERFCPGLAVSVAALCGPRGSVLLPPCRQHVTEDGRFEYRGGSVPLPTTALATRACRLARTALAALPPTKGYVGLDLVLGADPDGDQDVVIEVNPRLTTSYVGLRHVAKTNLAAAMLATARGNPGPLFFRVGTVEFDAGGLIIDHQTPVRVSS
jgi:tyramine---L-glutamate ligase